MTISDSDVTLLITDTVFSGNTGGGTNGSVTATVCVKAGANKVVPKLKKVVGLTPTTAPFPSVSGFCSQYMTQT